MTNAPAICTIISKNYLAHARTLTQSYLAQHPDGRVFVCLVDQIDGYYDPANEPFETVLSDQLGIPNWTTFSFKYSIMELNTAVKPYFMEYLFQNYDLDRLIYFDPDIVLYQPLAELNALLDQYGMVLTPHILKPLNDDRTPSELDLMQAGIYNLGFLAVSQRTHLQALFRWWKARLYNQCRVDFANAMFVDQRWMDLAPAMFPKVYIWRTPAANIAYWNFLHRRVEQSQNDSQTFVVDGLPVLFVHYSGFNVDQLEKVSKHQNRFVLSDLSAAQQSLMHDYRQRLLDNGFRVVSGWPYAYGQFGNRVPISDMARTWLLELDPDGRRWADPYNADTGSFFDFLNAPHFAEDTERPYLTNLAVHLYNAAPDVRAYLPTGLTTHQRDLMAWFCAYGKDRFKLDDVFLEPMGFNSAWGHSPLLGKLVSSGLRAANAGRQLGRQFGLAAVDKPYTATTYTRGVNVLGYLYMETGVGEVARSTLRSLAMIGYPARFKNIDADGGRTQDRSIDELGIPEGLDFPVNLMFVNADQTPVVRAALGAAAFEQHYTIGYWAWELPKFPTMWHDRLSMVDEVWGNSKFCLSGIAEIASIPVKVMPIQIEPEIDARFDRAHFGLPANRFLFLSAFDALSFTQRKNPQAVIRAFKKAFGGRRSGSEQPLLVVKVTNLNRSPEEQSIREMLAEVNGIIIDRYFSRVEVNSLINSCDAYVTLHRSEGFGLTLAEAMYMGKPTIGTDFSGNTDFMNAQNSYPIRYKLIPIEQTVGPYEAGQLWADADEDHAAAIMQQVVNTPDAELCRRAAADIRRMYSRDAVAQATQSRLDWIYANALKRN